MVTVVYLTSIGGRTALHLIHIATVIETEVEHFY